METIPQNRITPEQIERLEPNEIFVFGSNRIGKHYGKAARMAYESFGGGGLAEGVKGQTYAIPVVRAGVEMIVPHVDIFITFARNHPEIRFLVTRVGCGVAGFTDEEIAPLFAAAADMENVTLPLSFWRVLLQRKLYPPRIPARRIAPDNIRTLGENEIFVFGSNLAGKHYGGAARIACERFGAEWGVGNGLTGRSYAIPTMRANVEMIRPYVDEFIAFAREHGEYRFLVTRIGCGIAGFTDKEVAPLFAAAVDVENIALPSSFWNELAALDNERQ